MKNANHSSSFPAKSQQKPNCELPCRILLPKNTPIWSTKSYMGKDSISPVFPLNSLDNSVSNKGSANI